MTITMMTFRTQIITKLNLIIINPSNFPKSVTILFIVPNPKIKSRTFPNMNSKTMTKISSNPNINLLISLYKKLINRQNINRKPIKTNNLLPMLLIIPSQNPDHNQIKNYLFPILKIATSKINPNTSLISITNSHIHVNKYCNSLHKKSIVSIKNLELTLKRSMINSLDSSIKI